MCRNSLLLRYRKNLNNPKGFVPFNSTWLCETPSGEVLWFPVTAVNVLVSLSEHFILVGSSRTEKERRRNKMFRFPLRNPADCCNSRGVWRCQATFCSYEQLSQAEEDLRSGPTMADCAEWPRVKFTRSWPQADRCYVSF